MQAITSVTASGVPLLLDDIDTDRIIPARFLRCVTFDGLGDHAFEDDRRQNSTHPFDAECYQGGGILISGRNFGCGSSREHAPQSLMRWGIQAVIAESFAEIFFGNCTSLGIPAVTADRADLETLAAAVTANPAEQITIDLEAGTAQWGNETVAVAIPASAQEALTSGRWDFLSQLLEADAEIDQTAASQPYRTGFEVSRD